MKEKNLSQVAAGKAVTAKTKQAHEEQKKALEEQKKPQKTP